MFAVVIDETLQHLDHTLCAVRMPFMRAAPAERHLLGAQIFLAGQIAVQQVLLELPAVAEAQFVGGIDAQENAASKRLAAAGRRQTSSRRLPSALASSQASRSAFRPRSMGVSSIVLLPCGSAVELDLAAVDRYTTGVDHHFRTTGGDLDRAVGDLDDRTADLAGELDRRLQAHCAVRALAVGATGILAEVAGDIDDALADVAVVDLALHLALVLPGDRHFPRGLQGLGDQPTDGAAGGGGDGLGPGAGALAGVVAGQRGLEITGDGFGVASGGNRLDWC
ncbi:hypothetical protein G6F65_018265 [Rhizopus arrhizus]|nr:hypothetical protein G6F65_018265 [Rhizopus arrhizus]